MVGGLRLPLHTMELAVCHRSCHMYVPQTTLQGGTGCLVAVMDDWLQLLTNATLLKSTKHCHSLFRAL